VAAIRHGEQVAVSMDARAFGAFDDRTERTISEWRSADSAYVMVGMAAAVLIWSAGLAIR
jgi:energy-coupling factor transport system permease protein